MTSHKCNAKSRVTDEDDNDSSTICNVTIPRVHYKF